MRKHTADLFAEYGRQRFRVQRFLDPPPTLLDRVRSLFSQPINLRRDFTTFANGGGWGDRIEFQIEPGDDFGRVTGWKTPKPVKGDLLLSSMLSGSVGAFVFLDIEHMRNVGDMFNAKVYRYGYARLIEEAEAVSA